MRGSLISFIQTVQRNNSIIDLVLAYLNIEEVDFLINIGRI